MITTMSSMFAERSKQQVVETTLTNTNYVEENVVSHQQPLTSRSSFVFGELLLVVEGDMLSIYSKSMSMDDDASRATTRTSWSIESEHTMN